MTAVPDVRITFLELNGIALMLSDTPYLVLISNVLSMDNSIYFPMGGIKRTAHHAQLIMVTNMTAQYRNQIRKKYIQMMKSEPMNEFVKEGGTFD